MIKLFFLKNLNWKIGCYLMFIDFLKITFLPQFDLIYWGICFILLDLILGIVKSLLKGDFVISEGLRKTVVKLVQYVGVIFLMFLLTNVLSWNPQVTQRALKDFFGADNPAKAYQNLSATLQYLNSLVLLIILYTESLSISENLVQIDPKSPVSRFLLKPLHSLLSFKYVGRISRNWAKEIATKK